MKALLIAGLALMLITFGCIAQQTTVPTNNGPVTQPDGTIVQPDGTMIKPDGTMVKPDGTIVKPDGTMVKPDGTMILPDGSMIGPDGNPIEEDDSDDGVTTQGIAYVPFSLAAYNQAKAEGKTIFLEFYANWCPICKAQDPDLRSGLSQISSDNLVAFQVNYKDSDTDADETALAQQFNVTYQHTHVLIENNETIIFKSNEQWSSADVVAQLGAYA